MKIKKKLSKSAKQLLIGLLIGDGTISNNYVFKLSHSFSGKELLEWKLKELDKEGIKHNQIKSYVSTCGYNEGKGVLYSQLSIIPTIKALRRSIYMPSKTITKNLLTWLSPREIAIWYMDDGCVNINLSTQRSSIQRTIRIATCVNLDTVNMIIDYFKEKWDIKFRKFSEGNGFSIMTSTSEDFYKFINLVKPFVEQVPSMLYKIRNNYTKEEFLKLQAAKCETSKDDDIVEP